MEPPDWAALTDEQLLERRISKLGLRLETTLLEPLIQQLYAELSATGLAFHPPTHVGDDWYAQAHPDEDFAETFAIWLTPDFDWRKRYAGWKALQKLEYVDELMRSLAGKPPVHSPKYRVADYNFLNVKLKTYYARKRKLYEEMYPGFYDADLRQLFSAPTGIKASSYLRQRRRRLMNSVTKWTNEKKFRVNKLLTRLIDRSDELGLRVQNDDPQQDFRVASYITTLVRNYLFTGKLKRTK